MRPAKGANAEHLKEKKNHLKGMVDAVNVTDNPTAVVGCLVAASTVIIGEGMEPNFQMVCRDKNRLALMSDILGAYTVGIRNILCLTGDHQSFGNHPEAKNVYDIDSMRL
jgi:methylenetetrahydrofolate reductase (NADPH)